MLSFVVTKVTSDFTSRIGFYLFACLGLLSFLWARKIQGAELLRARIGVEIIYSTACLFGRYGVNRLKSRCKRVSLIG